MLIWSFGIIGVILVVLGAKFTEESMYGENYTVNTGIFFLVVFLIMLLIAGCCHIGTEAIIDKKLQESESLQYQIDNNLYDNTIDLGKKQLYQEVMNWNTTLANRKALQDNFWVGIFVPDIYDEIDFVKYR